MRIDSDSATVWADAGVTAGEYTTNAARHGLATGFGDAPSVAVGGITLAGGVGFLHRKLGLTIDSLMAAQVFTADGQTLVADQDSHPHLFWALRGGGGNFGVVTRLLFRLHPISQVIGGMLVLPATPATVTSFVEAVGEAPDKLSGLAKITIAPPMPFLPADVHGKPIVMAMLVHCGDVASADRALAPFARSTAPMKVAQIRVMGGAVARIDAGATAFAHRERRFMLNVAAAYARAEGADEHESWAAGLYDDLTRGGTGCYHRLSERGGAPIGCDRRIQGRRGID